MNNNLKYTLPVALVVFSACNKNQKADGITQKTGLVFKQGEKMNNG